MIVLFCVASVLISGCIWVIDVAGFGEPVALLILGTPALLVLRSAIKEMGRLRSGNEIVLTTSDFMERRVGAFGSRSEITIPWTRVGAKETVNTGAINDRKVLIHDKTTGRQLTYEDGKMPRYNELRAALIGRVGLEVSNNVWVKEYW